MFSQQHTHPIRALCLLLVTCLTRVLMCVCMCMRMCPVWTVSTHTHTHPTPSGSVGQPQHLCSRWGRVLPKDPRLCTGLFLMFCSRNGSRGHSGSKTGLHPSGNVCVCFRQDRPAASLAASEDRLPPRLLVNTPRSPVPSPGQGVSIWVSLGLSTLERLNDGFLQLCKHFQSTYGAS